MSQYIYGKNVVLSRLEKGDDIEKIYLQEGFKDKRFLKR
jgi:tRNA G18 (ribose-2'-O)-methylase SpoU